ncbi:MAG TPA: hypothetical protein VMZ53_01065 [Kofleriaceae bacterium]|nr:hypothetical protein [Kofleriaceae bacterium]
MPSHPRIRARGTPIEVPIGELTRALCYIPDVFHHTWVEAELALLHITVQTARSVDQLVSALVEDPPPRPQIVFANIGAMSPGELLHLHAIREQGWFGTVFAVGDASLQLRSSLRIERVLQPPLSRSLLRSALLGTSHAQMTTPIRRVNG